MSLLKHVADKRQAGASELLRAIAISIGAPLIVGVLLASLVVLGGRPLIVAMALAGALLVMVIVAGRLEWITYVVVFASPLIAYRHYVLGLNLTVQRAFLALGLVMVIWQIIVRRRRTVLVPPALVVLSAFILMKAADILRTQKLEAAGRAVGILVIGWLIVGLIVTTLNTEKKLRYSVIALILGSFFPVCVGIYQLLSPADFATATIPFAQYFNPREPGDPRMLVGISGLVSELGYFVRIGSTLGSPPWFGSYLAMVLFPLLAFAVNGRLSRWTKALCFAYAALLAVLVVATFSRSAWVVLVVGMLTLLGLSLRKGMVKQVAALVVVGGLASGVVFTLIPSWAVRDTVLPLLGYGSGFSDPRLAGHVESRSSALKIFAQAPIAGVGLGNFGAITGQGGILSSAESTVFTELAEGGIIGVTLITAFVMLVAWPMWHRLKWGRRTGELHFIGLGLLVAVLGLFLNSLLYEILYRDTSWTILGLGLAFASLPGGERTSAMD